MKKYQILLKNKTVEKDWYALEATIPDAMERCKSFLQDTPLDRLKSNGKLKKLRGKLDGILQYDISDSARVQYLVDSKIGAVYIEYIGYHP